MAKGKRTSVERQAVKSLVDTIRDQIKGLSEAEQIEYVSKFCFELEAQLAKLAEKRTRK